MNLLNEGVTILGNLWDQFLLRSHIILMMFSQQFNLGVEMLRVFHHLDATSDKSF
jgi:hypothetical protein